MFYSGAYIFFKVTHTIDMKNIGERKLLNKIGIVALVCLIISIFCFSVAKISNINAFYQFYLRDGKKANQEQSLSTSIKNGRGIISSFTTNYSTSGTARKHNIRLALSSLDNLVVHSGEEFSFNNTVGKRTLERGYQKALVIFKGSYTEGVGGGVCQVSTTLYNAWLLAGLDVVTAQAHTLPASYVDLSRDAMVSEWIDLVLKNSTDSDIRIKTSYTDDDITVSIEGEKREYEYSLKSQILKVIPPEEEVFELDEVGEDECYEGKDGYKSRLILVISKGGKKILSRVIREDYYKPQNTVKILRKSILN